MNGAVQRAGSGGRRPGPHRPAEAGAPALPLGLRGLQTKALHGPPAGPRLALRCQHYRFPGISCFSKYLCQDVMFCKSRSPSPPPVRPPAPSCPPHPACSPAHPGLAEPQESGAEDRPVCLSQGWRHRGAAVSSLLGKTPRAGSRSQGVGRSARRPLRLAGHRAGLFLSLC